MQELNIKCYAHLGDAVYEVFIREKIVFLSSKLSTMHKLNTSFVCASFQCELLDVLDVYLTDREKDLVRRGKNIPSNSRKQNQSLHRVSTGFEVLIGYLHLHEKKRLLEIFKLISDYIDSKDNVLK